MSHTGCEYFPSCFECPFPDCKFEETGPMVANLAKARALLEQGMTVNEIAAKMRKSKRTVNRYIKEAYGKHLRDNTED